MSNQNIFAVWFGSKKMAQKLPTSADVSFSLCLAAKLSNQFEKRLIWSWAAKKTWVNYFKNGARFVENVVSQKLF